MTKDKDIKTVVPALRFPEFRDAEGWKERPLIKVAHVIAGQSPEGSSYNENGVGMPFYQGKTDFGEIFLNSPTKWTTQTTKTANEGDILMSVRAPVGTLNISTNEICIGRGLAAIQPYQNKWFLYYFLNSIQNSIIGNGGSVFDSINKDQIEKIEILIPENPKEQETIANCLGSLDDLISAVTDKIEALKEHKKGLMQQLFPADGKTTPTLRFPKFQNAGEWRETTLVKLAKFRRGSFPQPYGLPEWFDENGIPFIQVYDVDDNMLLKPQTKSKISELAAKQSVFIPKETVIITIQGSIGRVAITQYDAYIDRTLLLFEEFYKPLNKVFFAYILQLLFDIEKQKAPGGIIKTITKEVLSDFKVNMPNIDEQQKIADCLSSIDKLISAETDKLNQLKAHKKGLMQRLFPTINE